MKIAVVTGASRGIGFELVKNFLKNKWSVVAVSRSELRITEIENEGIASSNLISVQGDLSEESTLGKIYDEVSKFGELNVVVNNAGLLVNKPFANLLKSDLMSMLNVNYLAPFFLVQKMLPFLEKSDQPAHVVNISTMGAVQGSAKFSGLSGYSSSKGALSILTECMAEELKKHNVRCNALALGAVQTEMLEEAFPGYEAPISAKEMGEYIFEFSDLGHLYQNGKIISLALTTP